MAGDVRVTIGANLAVTTSGVEEAKRQAAEVQAAADGVSTSAHAAGNAMQEAMQEAAQAARDAADALRRAGGQPVPARAGEFPPNRPAPAAPTLTPDGGAALAYDPRTHAHRASTMLHGIEAHLAGGITSEAQLAQLEARARRASYYVDAARQGGLPDPQLDALSEHLQAVAEALDENRGAIEKNTTAGGAGGASPEAGGENAALAAVTDELKRLASGGLSGLGIFGRFLGRAGLVGLGVGAVVGSVAMATRALTSLHGEAREEISGLADLARQYETPANPLSWFRQTSGTYAGFTREDIQRLGFGATDATAFMARLDLPGGGEDGYQTAMRDTVAGLRFSRATGISEGNVADLLRTLGLGGIERGQSDRALAIIREAMREGVREGVSSSDTMRNLEQAFSGMFRSGVNLTETGVAFQAGLLTAAARSGDRQWQGAQGAAGLERMQTAMLGGGDLGMQLALARYTGEFTAADLGLTGERAATYEGIRRVDPVTALQLVISLAPSRPEVLTRFAAALDQVFGGDARLKYQYLSSLGLDADQVFALLGSTALTNLTRQAAEEAERMSGAGTEMLDAQAGNRLAYTTPQLAITERDAAFAFQVESLSRAGGMEEELRKGVRDFLDLRRRILRGVAPGESLFGVTNFGAPAGVGTGDFGVTLGDWDDTAARASGSTTNRIFGVTYGTAAADDARAAAALLPNLARVESSGDPTAVNGRTGAFGLTQILPSNLTGAAGWDREFMGRSPHRQDWRNTLIRNGLDPDDPIPDHIAAQGGDALVAWRASLEPNAREAVDIFLASLSDEKLAEYMNRARASGADDFTAQVAAAAVWYSDHEPYLTGGSLMHPDNPRFKAAQGTAADPEPSHQEYLERLFGPLEYHDDGTVSPKSSGTRAPTGPLEVIVRVEGLDAITVTGVEPSHRDRIAASFGQFLTAIATPASHRGA